MSNLCVVCKEDLGESNPRQLCGKTWCPQMIMKQSEENSQDSITCAQSPANYSYWGGLSDEDFGSGGSLPNMWERPLTQQEQIIRNIETLLERITSEIAQCRGLLRTISR